jgi:hypothetical protein
MMFFILNFILWKTLGKTMKPLEYLLSTVALVTLAACSSSGDEGTAILAAPIPPVAPPTTAGETAFANAQEGLQNLPTFDPNSSNNQQSTDTPTFNSDGSVGRATLRVSDDGLETLTLNVNGEEFTVTNSQSQSGFIVSDDGRLTAIGPDQTGLPNLRGVVNSAILIQTENPIENRTLPGADEIENIAISIDGALTPIADLPAQATYSGGFVVVSSSSVAGASQPEGAGTNGTFNATATFGQTNELTGNLFDGNDNANVATIQADITGNTFNGTITDNEGAGTTSLDGGFFGQNAEAIAGAGTGEVEGETISIGLIGTRTDNVPIN